MIREEEVFHIGRLGKTHGVHGELSFMFDDDVFDRVDADYLVLNIDGILVPFFIEEYRFRSDNSALVKFEDIDTQERARELTNCDVYFPYKLADNDKESISWSQIIGFMLTNAHDQQPIGRITRIDDQTMNILFELEDGRLIPATDDFVTDIDMEGRTICVDLPEGLLNL